MHDSMRHAFGKQGLAKHLYCIVLSKSSQIYVSLKSTFSNIRLNPVVEWTLEMFKMYQKQKSLTHVT